MRLDFLFSIWLFVWFLGYAAKLIQYSPEIFLWAAVLFELRIMWNFYQVGYPLLFASIFVGVNVCIKALPLWYLHGKRAYSLADVLFGLLLGLLYLGWLRYNETSASAIYGEVQDLIRSHRLLPVEQRVMDVFQKKRDPFTYNEIVY